MAVRDRKRRSLDRKRWGLVGLVTILSAGLLLTVPPSSAAPSNPTGIVCRSGPTFSMRTARGSISTPDGNSIFMWGFKITGTPFQAPGPTLCVTEGQTVTITLTNPTKSTGGPGETVSMVFPGQSGVTTSGGSCPTVEDCLFAARAAAPGGSVTYRFTASQPGTYLYESGTRPDKQIQMGLYGALIVRPSMGADFAYDDATTRFDPTREYLIIINEIDPVIHRAVQLGKQPNVNAFDDDYWTINGRSFPDTISDNGVSWLPNQPYGALVQIEPYDAATNPYPALIRYANAGLVNHPFHPHGNHMRVIAQDGRMLLGPGGEDASYEDFTRTIGAGQTYDLLFGWEAVDPWITSNDPPEGVEIPGFQNLVFKDGATFYGGDPNLGQQGEFPPGVTSFNECGEFYFPWHSHALFEFTNFDEGFGGLATLLRVDPPGGCDAVQSGLHVGDLAGASESEGGGWAATVTVTVDDWLHSPVGGAGVSGTWSDGLGSGSCTTEADGTCSISVTGVPNALGSVAFSVDGITKASFTYRPAVNHDGNGDSDGTTIVVAGP